MGRAFRQQVIGHDFSPVTHLHTGSPGGAAASMGMVLHQKHGFVGNCARKCPAVMALREQTMARRNILVT
jgi:hypothetical protein